MAQQSSGEFASDNPTKGKEDARVQERGIRAKISLNPRSHLQHLQRPTPSDISKNAPSLQGLSHAGVARSRRRRMISAVKPDEPASNFQQRDDAIGEVWIHDESLVARQQSTIRINPRCPSQIFV